ncbi:MAG: heme exporter protein CcmD [Betaproteobacteria bacterium]|nr:heme exporter protein CcmD [Betaproteobacteria bacterium]MCC6246301.1 heme exporter protein CcmD [Rubrivivax sp.]MCL4697384.1 heme exporter protein CcmD [Burkholderiaceae bacterium]
MNWGSASEFFAMGGYGLYVWGSYGVTLLAMVAEPWLTARQHRQALAAAAEASFEEAALDDAPRSGES